MSELLIATHGLTKVYRGGVTAVDHRLDDLLLGAAERVVAEDLAEHVEGGRGQGGVRDRHGGQCARGR